MFGPLGVPEILFILVLALLIFGPRRLPDVGRTLGKAMGEFRRASTELKRSINTEIALEDEDEKPRYTRTARPERGAEESGGGGAVAAGEEAARKDEAPPRREDGEELDLGRWTRRGGEEGEGGAKAAAQPGTVPRSAAGPAGDGGGDPGDEPGDDSGGEGSGGDRDPEA